MDTQSEHSRHTLPQRVTRSVESLLHRGGDLVGVGLGEGFPIVDGGTEGTAVAKQ